MANSNFITKMLLQSKGENPKSGLEDLDEEAYRKALQEEFSSSFHKDLPGVDKKNDCIISFNSVNRIRFEFLTCLLVLYDCIMLPFDIAFDSKKALHPNMEIIHSVIDEVLKLVYLIDFCLCFRKAYLDERIGKEIRDPRLIAIRYLKCYFWFDLLSVLPFKWFTDNVYLYETQLLKVVRLLRLNKIISFLNLSLYSQSKIRLFYLVIRFFIIIHWTTCFLYYQVTQNKNLLDQKEA